MFLGKITRRSRRLATVDPTGNLQAGAARHETAPGGLPGSGMVAVAGAPLVRVLVALAEHHSELIDSGEFGEDVEEAGFVASLACWAAMLEADEHGTADMLGALRAFGYAPIAERITTALGLGTDRPFARRQQEAEARHRLGLHVNAAASPDMFASRPARASATGGSSALDRIRAARQN